jgi:hypothetical protein
LVKDKHNRPQVAKDSKDPLIKVTWLSLIVKILAESHRSGLPLEEIKPSNNTKRQALSTASSLREAPLFSVEISAGIT